MGISDLRGAWKSSGISWDSGFSVQRKGNTGARHLEPG